MPRCLSGGSDRLNKLLWLYFSIDFISVQSSHPAKATDFVDFSDTGNLRGYGNVSLETATR